MLFTAACALLLAAGAHAQDRTTTSSISSSPTDTGSELSQTSASFTSATTPSDPLVTSIFWGRDDYFTFTNTKSVSLVDVRGGKSTFAINCEELDDSVPYASCNSLLPSFTFTAAPTLKLLSTQIVTAGASAIISVNCDVKPGVSASCTESISLSGGPIQTSITTGYTVEATEMAYMQIRITAGAENINGAKEPGKGTGKSAAAPKAAGHLYAAVAGVGAVLLGVAAL